MRKKSVNIRLDDMKLDYVDYIAGMLDPKPNRSKAISVLIDLVYANFSDDMVQRHANVAQLLDFRAGRKNIISD